MTLLFFDGFAATLLLLSVAVYFWPKRRGKMDPREVAAITRRSFIAEHLTRIYGGADG